jgi:hypothetical protein
MKTRILIAVLALAIGCQAGELERVVISKDSKGFELASSRKPFHPWGFNYGNAGRLMEDFWDKEWETIEGDFKELHDLGANVVRIHLQVGKFMKGPREFDRQALHNLQKMLTLAERAGIYLDVTGLACYRPSDIPEWYGALEENARWETQARFWEQIARTCRGSKAVFCYDLMNEPISPAQRREPGKWMSGNLFGGYDFVQYIALDPAGRSRETIAVEWIRKLSAAIRRQDTNTLVTVGLLPWSQKWKHLSGFIPEKIAPAVDFISVHIYPDRKEPAEAMQALKVCAVGKPVVIEETFALACDIAQVEAFLRESREIACGWIGHYDGLPLPELDSLAAMKKLTIPQSMMRDWLKLCVRLKPEMVRSAAVRINE